MRLLVDVEVATKRGTEIQSFETTVRAVSRSVNQGVASDDVVLVEAYIPPLHRRSIVAPLSSWKSSEVLRCSARVRFNRHTLRDFMESGARRWTFEKEGE